MKRLPPHFAIAAGYRTLAIALTVFLFVVGSFPAAGQAFPGVTHWIAHLAAYAVIAFAYGLGWQKQPAILVASFVAALGGIHEYSEIFTHNHELEIADILVNSIGASIGVALERALVPATARA
jgi:VanZ family protein